MEEIVRKPGYPAGLRFLTEKPDPRRVRVRGEDHVEELIDEALQETFPASDPPAPAVASRAPQSDTAGGVPARSRKSQ
jgi:hypothetical protein